MIPHWRLSLVWYGYDQAAVHLSTYFSARQCLLNLETLGSVGRAPSTNP